MNPTIENTTAKHTYVNSRSTFGFLDSEYKIIILDMNNVNDIANITTCIIYTVNILITFF